VARSGTDSAPKKERCAEPAGWVDPEVEKGDAEEDRYAVGDDHEHQRVAIVALIEKVTLRAALKCFESAPEEVSFATLRAAPAQTAAKGDADRRVRRGGDRLHRAEETVPAVAGFQISRVIPVRDCPAPAALPPRPPATCTAC